MNACRAFQPAWNCIEVFPILLKLCQNNEKPSHHNSFPFSLIKFPFLILFGDERTPPAQLSEAQQKNLQPCAGNTKGWLYCGQLNDQLMYYCPHIFCYMTSLPFFNGFSCSFAGSPQSFTFFCCPCFWPTLQDMW